MSVLCVSYNMCLMGRLLFITLNTYVTICEKSERMEFLIITAVDRPNLVTHYWDFVLKMYVTFMYPKLRTLCWVGLAMCIKYRKLWYTHTFSFLFRSLLSIQRLLFPTAFADKKLSPFRYNIVIELMSGTYEYSISMGLWFRLLRVCISLLETKIKTDLLTR